MKKMGSETEVKLPIIDFSVVELESNVAEWESVKSQVHKALVEYGCFEAVFDEVPLHIRKAIFFEVDELFNLPLETKKLAVSSKPFRGYVGPIQLYESIGIDDADVYEKVESLINILWPQGKSSFRYALQTTLFLTHTTTSHTCDLPFMFEHKKSYKSCHINQLLVKQQLFTS